MSEHKTNYSNLNYLSVIRFGHCIGAGWYPIVARADMKLRKLGHTIEKIERRDGALSIFTELEADKLNSRVQNILYEAEQESEMTCEWCGNYSVSQIFLDKECLTLCEACQEKCDSREGVDKRLHMYHLQELEKEKLHMERIIERLENKLQHYRMGRDHFKEKSERLEALVNNDTEIQMHIATLKNQNKPTRRA